MSLFFNTLWIVFKFQQTEISCSLLIFKNKKHEVSDIRKGKKICKTILKCLWCTNSGTYLDIFWIVWYKQYKWLLQFKTCIWWLENIDFFRMYFTCNRFYLKIYKPWKWPFMKFHYFMHNKKKKSKNFLREIKWETLFNTPVHCWKKKTILNSELITGKLNMFYLLQFSFWMNNMLSSLAHTMFFYFK